MSKSLKKSAKKAKTVTPKAVGKKGANQPLNQSKPEQPAKLTPSERKTLDGYELVIEVGLNCYQTVGNALCHISDRELYRADHKSFKDYCRERWQMGAAHAYRLIKAAKFVELLKQEDGDSRSLPAHESVVRPIIDGLRECRWLTAWQKAVKSTKGKVLTAKIVAKVVAKMTGQKPSNRPHSRSDGTAAQQKVLNAVKKLVLMAKRKRTGTTLSYFKKVMDKILHQLESRSSSNKPKSKD